MRRNEELQKLLQEGYTYGQARYIYNCRKNGKDSYNSRHKELTKQELIDIGITNVTKDGRVFIGENELEPISGRYLSVYIKPKSYYIHRIVYVWYNDIQPSDKVIDHIDENKWNNNIDNLQLLSRGENIKKGHNFTNYLRTNQFTKNLSQEELLNRKKVKKEIDESRKRINIYVKDIKLSTERKKGLKTKNKSLYMDYMYNIDVMKDLLRKEKEKLNNLKKLLNF